MTAAEIIVLRHLDAGIYKSEGGGETRVLSRHASGPRGLTNALISHSKERYEASRYYGSIGAGAGWIEIVPKHGQPGSGTKLPSTLLWEYQDARGKRGGCGCIECRDGTPQFCLNRGFLPPQPPVQASLEWWQGQIAAHNKEMDAAHAQTEREDEEHYRRMGAEIAAEAAQ